MLRLALHREFHRRDGAEALIGRPTYNGSGQQNDWEAGEAALDRMIQRLGLQIRAQENARAE